MDLGFFRPSAPVAYARVCARREREREREGERGRKKRGRANDNVESIEKIKTSRRNHSQRGLFRQHALFSGKEACPRFLGAGISPASSSLSSSVRKERILFHFLTLPPFFWRRIGSIEKSIGIIVEERSLDARRHLADEQAIEKRTCFDWRAGGARRESDRSSRRSLRTSRERRLNFFERKKNDCERFSFASPLSSSPRRASPRPGPRRDSPLGLSSPDYSRPICAADYKLSLVLFTQYPPPWYLPRPLPLEYLPPRKPPLPPRPPPPLPPPTPPPRTLSPGTFVLFGLTLISRPFKGVQSSKSAFATASASQNSRYAKPFGWPPGPVGMVTRLTAPHPWKCA